MREVFGEILEKNCLIIFELLPFLLARLYKVQVELL